MQIDLIDTLAQTGEMLATYLDTRVRSAKKLSGMIGTSLDIAMESDTVENLAQIVRQHIDAIKTLQNALVLEQATARAYEGAVADGMALVALIRSCSLAELTNFWHRQRAKP